MFISAGNIGKVKNPHVIRPYVSTNNISENLGVLSGNYTYKNLQGNFENNRPPLVKNVQISGNSELGETLSVTFDTTLYNNAPITNTIIKWYTVLNGVTELLATSSTYLLTANEVGKQIYTGIQIETDNSTEGNGNNISNESYSKKQLVLSNIQEAFKLNFNGVDAVPGWINISNTAQTITNINGSGLDFTIVSVFSGTGTNGVNTNNDSGVVPDNVLRTFFFLSTTNISIAQLRVSGLPPNAPIILRFGGSRASNTARPNTQWELGGVTAKYDASQNSIEEYEISANADTSGVANITVRLVDTTTFGYANWLKVLV